VFVVKKRDVPSIESSSPLNLVEGVVIPFLNVLYPEDNFSLLIQLEDVESLSLVLWFF
jgi:hypothetical protein